MKAGEMEERAPTKAEDSMIENEIGKELLRQLNPFKTADDVLRDYMSPVGEEADPTKMDIDQ